MAAGFYYILAYPKYVTDNWGPGEGKHQPVYLGKTANLSFKVEPEKTIDCDDGTTIVGSEKVSLSFSLLERIDDSMAITKILLLPAMTGENQAAVTPSWLAAIEVDFGDAGDYQWEVKSGEFELVHFSATVRSASGTPSYRMIENFYTYNRVHIITRSSSCLYPRELVKYSMFGSEEPDCFDCPEASILVEPRATAIIGKTFSDCVELGSLDFPDGSHIEYNAKDIGVFFHHLG